MTPKIKQLFHSNFAKTSQFSYAEKFATILQNNFELAL